MASSLNANVVDLHAENKSSRKKPSSASSSSGVMEIRTRRIQQGELLSTPHYAIVETAFNLALSALIGLILRWILGLLRSLRLSRVNINGGDYSGVCCSPYRGLESDTKSSFEKLLACVLMKSEGDEAGKLLLTLLWVFLFVAVYKLAVASCNPNLDGESTADTRTTDEKGRYIYRRVPRQKVKRFFVLVGAVLSALWLFHTPALLRYFGLIGLIEAVNELGARILLLGNLIGVVSIPLNDPLFGHSAMVQNLSNLLLTLFAMLWGVYASILVECIQETARNAAFVLSSNPAAKSRNRKQTPDEMMALVNTRIMLIIQAVAPLVIICTFFAEAHFAEMVTKSARGGGQASFSKQYLQNSGQFVRVGLSWSFLGASVYTIRALLQSYLDQASTVASAMSIYREAAGSKSKQTNPKQPDPFSDRYSKVVPTAGKIAAFPAFVFAILMLAHLRGGDVSVHPGVGNENVDALSAAAIKGLVPGYSGEYATLTASRKQSTSSLLQAASLSRSTWEETPLRDKAHRYISDWMGRDKYCSPPSSRAVKSMGRELNYMVLQSNDVSIDEETTLPIPINGAQLLEYAHLLPYTLIDVILGRRTSSNDETCSNDMTESEQTCMASTIPMQTIVSSVFSHNILTPTIVIPTVETLTLLSSILWTAWYTVMVVWYWMKIRKSDGLHISA
ncbi:hypothetical protein ACHAXN_005122 [Cyclotella atomus]